MSRAKRGFATVVQEKSGRYSVRYTTAGGIRASAGKTFARKADAEAWAADKRRDIDRAQIVTREKIIFSAYSATWLANRHRAGRPIKERTREHYQTILDKFLIPAFGAQLLSEITPKQVREWHATTLADAPTYRSHAYSLLKTIMASAINDELIDSNPCRIVGAGSAKRAKKIQPATVEQLRIITEEMPERLQLAILLGSWCAERWGEVSELRRKDIDLDARVIHIRRGAYRIKGGIKVGDTKSEAGVRTVAIPPHLIPAIEKHLDKHVGTGPESLLFPSVTGKNMNQSTFYRHYDKARIKAHRDDLRFHDLRHTGATLAASTGASVAELMARLGHSSPQAAMRYQHAAQSRDHEIAALLSKLAQ
jgi:integrase